MFTAQSGVVLLLWCLCSTGVGVFNELNVTRVSLWFLGFRSCASLSPHSSRFSFFATPQRPHTRTSHPPFALPTASRQLFTCCCSIFISGTRPARHGRLFALGTAAASHRGGDRTHARRQEHSAATSDTEVRRWVQLARALGVRQLVVAVIQCAPAPPASRNTSSCTPLACASPPPPATVGAGSVAAASPPCSPRPAASPRPLPASAPPAALPVQLVIVHSGGDTLACSGEHLHCL
jgi:hypothetical protein